MYSREDWTLRTRNPIPEVLVKGGEFRVVRKKETYDEMLSGESVPEFGGWNTGPKPCSITNRHKISPLHSTGRKYHISIVRGYGQVPLRILLTEGTTCCR